MHLEKVMHNYHVELDSFPRDNKQFSFFIFQKRKMQLEREQCVFSANFQTQGSAQMPLSLNCTKSQGFVRQLYAEKSGSEMPHSLR